MAIVFVSNFISSIQSFLLCSGQTHQWHSHYPLRCPKGITTKEKGKTTVFSQSLSCHGNLASSTDTHLKRWPLCPHRGTDQTLEHAFWSFPGLLALFSPLLFLFNPMWLPIPAFTKGSIKFQIDHPDHLPFCFILFPSVCCTWDRVRAPNIAGVITLLFCVRSQWFPATSVIRIDS